MRSTAGEMPFGGADRRLKAPTRHVKAAAVFKGDDGDAVHVVPDL